ncbi:AAA domain-containing protein, putative AbiEii toxin, Type IV TA system [Marinitoga hydrogenitolerans DSM 16785]|uniref:AAA domain-containing protein, putative AbiEii toxin, Type IV TA system n=1 Tax=Marinitoga hydrogenitolerans (strain DSM 16785 / JCM 12826 / AT1271) TaxID=1122195 RepID=A0A1M4TQE4_MARH1|nr:AAA family ATPase [Marinitoga hydrogenitolerans]SHE46702.1 AAA domain-containing protein, putative AbiEii toxin, Type IV TA system [Marinitoga hydrogenitolerans DSM 16785]
MVTKVEIKKFRNFENVTFEIGKLITLISGQNALGKSTLLAMIGNAFELKVKDGRPLLQNQFRTEFSEIIKLSKHYDLDKAKKEEWEYTICFRNDNYDDYRKTRLYYNKNHDRIRITPRGKLPNGKQTSAKIKWPVLYLGLSRLYPIGETRKNELYIKNGPKLNEEDIKWYQENYNNILSLHLEHENYKQINYKNLKFKKTLGHETKYYDFLTNSAGQDNLSQIIMAVLSFKKLRETYENYKGGILLIDELDATLHPSAQIELLDFLKKESKKLNLQIIATTHSLVLIETFLKKYVNSCGDNCQQPFPYKLVYLKRIGDIKASNIDIDSYEKIEAILKNEAYAKKEEEKERKKIRIFSEDAEARWLIKKLLKDYLDYVKLLEMSQGSDSLIEIRKYIEEIFYDSIIIFDSDVKKKEKFEEIKNKYDNILVLPGNENENPELVIYNYLNSLNPDDEIFERAQKFNEIHFDYILFKNKTFDKFKKNIQGEKNDDRILEKRWFNHFKQVFDTINLFERWKEDNKDVVDEFVDEFIRVYNNLATLNNLPKIKRK